MVITDRYRQKSRVRKETDAYTVGEELSEE
jgi:hypothetical protein